MTHERLVRLVLLLIEPDVADSSRWTIPLC